MNALARTAEHQEWLEERLAAIEPGEVARQAVLAREVAGKVRAVAEFMAEKLGPKSDAARSFRKAEATAGRVAKLHATLAVQLGEAAVAAQVASQARASEEDDRVDDR